jgi:hypothetical protein
MKCYILILFIIALYCMACNNTTSNFVETKSLIKQDSLPSDEKDTTTQFTATVPDSAKPIFGYRFIIHGDFNGDGKQEDLVEHYISLLDNKETPKFYDGLKDYTQQVDITIKKQPIVFALCSDNTIDTLSIDARGQLFGLSYLKNEGDLDDDGKDEVSYVIDHADWSNINSCHIMSYKKNKWVNIYSFGIWDWQLPGLPQSINDYRLFGIQDKIIIEKEDNINAILEQELLQFKGFIKKISASTFQVRFRNDEASEDSVIVNFKKK